MADDKSTTEEESVDTSEDQVADTSVDEETSTNDADDLEDMQLSDEEIESGELKEDAEETEEESEEEAEESEEVVEESEEDEGAKEEDTTSEADKARAAKVAFEQREAVRRAEQTKAQQDYLEQAEDDKDLALRQLQIDAYNNRVEISTAKLQTGIDKAVASIDLFRDGSPEVKEELANSLDDFERMYVKRDRNGNPIEVRADVYQYLQSKADSIARLTNIGARQQTKSKANEKSRTLNKPSRVPKEGKVDPELAAFDEEANRW